ncbi:glycoside hydrolase superfamily [Tuber brumale]|nr:glycoside hydrolase superfamily [Tuber brumale]
MFGMKAVAYFVNWGIYGRNYQPQDIPASHLTHILYSFANVRPESGEVYLSDTYSDLEKRYPTDSWNDVGTNVYGCIKQLFLLKKPSSPSEGGPTLPTLRRQQLRLLAGLHSPGLLFNSSGTWDLMASILIGMPFHATQAQNFVSLLAECRTQLDAYGNQYAPGQKLLLTIAAPCGATHYTKLLISQMNQYLDFWNLMAYDFAGSWDATAGHQANLYHSTSSPVSTPFNANEAVNAYIAGGVPCNKIILGMPLYGRSFQATTGPGASFAGIGSGSWENGVWDYKALPKAGATECADSSAVASWSYDPATREMISFDTPTVARTKSSYILEKGLGGGMWWELSSDKAIGDPQSLIKITVDRFGGTGSLETTNNILAYPGSKYDNLRNQCGSE